MADLFTVANEFETASVEDRTKLKEVIRGIVGYACKIACKSNNGCVDIYVYSELRNRVTDWIEIQPSGAIGVIFDMYDDPDSKAVGLCDTACCEYNNERDLEFDDESDDDESCSSSPE
jgi:hypothetical protein